MLRCPGNDPRFWKPDDIVESNCPACGTPIEFWKDEPKLQCPKCKNLVTNPKLDLGCTKWCKYAQKCLGFSTSQSDNILCNQLVEEMKKIFAGNYKQIGHSLEVLKYAGLIQATEGGNPLVVKAAAILLDITMFKATDTSGTMESPATAAEILTKYGIESELIEQVRRIIANYHSAKNIDSTEYRIVWDAGQLVNICEQSPNTQGEEIKKLIDSTFKTKKGCQIAMDLLTGSPG